MANYRLELLGKGAASDPDNGLTILTLSGDEDMSKVPCYSIEVLSRNADIRPNEVLMQAYSVKCAFDDEEGNWHSRYFNGHAVKFSPVPEDEGSFGHYAKYRIELRPWLWFLGLRRNCWIFQGKSVQEIIDELLQRYPSAPAAEWRIAPPRKKREYCVQYRESDLDFFSRLLEEEGIHYWFEHRDDQAVLVLGNGTHAVTPLPADDTLIYAAQLGSEQRYNELHRWGYECQLCPDSIRLWDYDFITCEKREQMLKAEIPEHLLEDQNSQFDSFDYPAGFVEDQGNPESNPVCLDEQAEIRLAELRSRQEIFVGTSEWPDIAVGYTVNVDNHPNPELNQKVIIFSTHWSLADSGHDSQWLPEDQLPQTLCHFKAFSFQYWQRPRTVTRKPVIPGSQTAIVVGKESDEIHTDRHGRIKVRFHWDWNGSDDIKDENRSCWVRVAQLWAGNGWGTQFIPRVGQEVVVSFLEGDPDRPLVTGSVYNGRNKPAYEQPKNLTQSGIRTQSSPGGGAKDFNELTFEDKKGKEAVYFKAQRRMDINVGQNFYQYVKGESNVRIGGNSRTSVERDQHTKVHGQQRLWVKNEVSWVSDTGFYTQAPKLWLHGSHSLFITSHKNEAGGQINIESRGHLILECGESQIALTPDAIRINAPRVEVNSGNQMFFFDNWGGKNAEDATGFKHDSTSLGATQAPALSATPTASPLIEGVDASPIEPPEEPEVITFSLGETFEPKPLPRRPQLPNQGIRSITTTMHWECTSLKEIANQGDAALAEIDALINDLESKLNALVDEAADMSQEAVQYAADLVGKAQVTMNEAKTQIASTQTSVCQALEDKGKQFQRLAQNTVNGVCNAANQAAQATNAPEVQSALSRAGIAGQFNQGINQANTDLQNQLSALQSTANNVVSEAVETSQDVVNAAGDTLTGALDEGAKALASGAEKLKSGAGSAINKASNATRDALKAAIAAARSAKKAAQAAIALAKVNVCLPIPGLSSALDIAKREAQRIGNTANALIREKANMLEDMAKDANKQIRQAGQQIADHVEDAFNEAKDKANQVERAVREQVDPIIDEVKDTVNQVEEAYDDAKAKVTEIRNRVKQAEQVVQERTGQLAEQIESAVSEAQQQYSEAVNTARQVAANAKQALSALV